MIKGKRGVSPLVATILLIAFAVALGAVIMQFGEAAVRGICGSNIQLQATACASGTDTTTIKFTIANKGSEDLSAVKVEAQGASSSNTKEYAVKIPARTGRESSIPFSAAIFGELKGMKFTPVVDTTACDENAEYLPKVQVGNC